MSEPRTVAIIGASSDRRKFGNKAVRAYAAAGWRVYPIHPKEAVVEGIPTFASIEAAPDPIELVSVYVPPSVGITLLPAIAARHPRQLLVNPGAESPELLLEAERLGLPVVAACSIIAVGKNPHDFPDS
jgi:predicted CoA-binding protein